MKQNRGSIQFIRGERQSSSSEIVENKSDKENCSTHFFPF